LVEVALAVAVGLIIIGGAVMGYGALKDQSAGAEGRRKVAMAGGMIQEYAAGNDGRFPTSVEDDADGASTGSFTAMWVKKVPEDHNKNPWGGPTGDDDGVTELAPFETGEQDPAAAPDETDALATDGTRAGNIIYASIDGGKNIKIQQSYNPNATIAKAYVISIYDRTGSPWFHMSSNNL
jgi:hypothetical protein